MKRDNIIWFFLLLFLIVNYALLAQYKYDFSKYKIDVNEFRKGFLMIRTSCSIGNPTMLAFYGEDGILLVDDAPTPEITNDILKRIKEYTNSNVKYIINTHWHGDHTGGNKFFYPNASIIGNENLYKRLSSDPVLEVDEKIMDRKGWPNITIMPGDSLTIRLNSEVIKVYALNNSHTDTDALIYFQNAKVLCVGDHYIVNQLPAVDIDSDGDLDGFMNTLDYIKNSFPPETKIIPGHPLFSPAPVKPLTMNGFQKWVSDIKESIDFVKRKINSGKSLEEIQKEGLPEKYKPFVKRPRYVKEDVWIETIYENEKRHCRI
jgi:cyclase